MKISKKMKKNFLKEIFNKKNISENSLKIRKAFSDAVDIPSYAIANTTKTTILEDNNILIEGYKSIEDYFTNYIKVKCNTLSIVIDGKDLDIKEITDDDLVIKGEIFSINFKKI